MVDQRDSPNKRVCSPMYIFSIWKIYIIYTYSDAITKNYTYFAPGPVPTLDILLFRL